MLERDVRVKTVSGERDDKARKLPLKDYLVNLAGEAYGYPQFIMNL